MVADEAIFVSFGDSRALRFQREISRCDDNAQPDR